MESEFNPRYRHPVDLRGSLQVAGRTPIEGRVRNLSMAGAMIEHAYRLIAGQPCLLCVALGEQEVVLEARVVWSKPFTEPTVHAGEAVPVCRSGLQFAALPELAEIHLRAFLASLVAAHPSP